MNVLNKPQLSRSLEDTIPRLSIFNRGISIPVYKQHLKKNTRGKTQDIHKQKRKQNGMLKIKIIHLL